MYGYIYETTNLVNGKKYIGQHKGSYDCNYLGSGIALTRAIKKYRKENFVTRVIEYAQTREELNNKEKLFIKECSAIVREDYYNIAHGGEGGDTFTGANRIMVGHKHSEEWKNHISEGNKGKRSGLKESEETRNKKQESHKGKIRVTKDNKGTWIYPNELESYLANGYEQKGVSVNSGDSHYMRKQIGMYCWVNDGTKDVRIKCQQLEEFLINGYIKGRVFKPRKKRSTTIEKD